MKLRKMLALSRAVGRNEMENVETLCSEALATDQRDLMALMALADAYWRNQRREDALTVALQALEVEPNEFYALRIVAGVYAERGEHEPAYRYARRLLDALGRKGSGMPNTIAEGGCACGAIVPFFFELPAIVYLALWFLSHPITYDEAQRFGLKVRSDIPREFLELMGLYPQPIRRQPSVEYLPVPRRSERTDQKDQE